MWLFDFSIEIVYNRNMKKKLLALFLAVLFCFPLLVSAASPTDSIIKTGDTGSDVYALQRRLYELGYLNYRPTGKFSDMTASAVRKFQQLNGIDADGQIGQSTQQKLFSDNVVRNEANPQFKMVVGRAYTGEVKDKAELSAWEAINQAFPVGSVATVKDYNTGSVFHMKRTGGVNCAQVITETADDYDTYLYVFGGETWEHRSVFVTIGGTEYAASLFGMPTGTERLAGEDNMRGYTVLYFNNSKTDVNSLDDEEHVIAIERIAKSS